MELIKKLQPEIISNTLNDKSYCRNCKVCYAWEELFLDNVLEKDNNLIIIDDKIFVYKCKNEKIAHLPFTSGDKTYVYNKSMKYLSALYLQTQDIKIEPKIYFAAQCGFDYKQLKHSTLDICEFNPYTLLKYISDIYRVTAKDKFLHGNPDIKNIVCTYDGIYKIKTSQESSFQHQNSCICKSHPDLHYNIFIEENDEGDFFKIKTDLGYSRFNPEYYSYLKNMEIYQWAISMMKNENHTQSKEWTEYFRSLWRPEEYINVLLEMETLSPFELTNKFWLKKDI